MLVKTTIWGRTMLSKYFISCGRSIAISKTKYLVLFFAETAIARALPNILIHRVSFDFSLFGCRPKIDRGKPISALKFFLFPRADNFLLSSDWRMASLIQ